MPWGTDGGVNLLPIGLSECDVKAAPNGLTNGLRREDPTATSEDTTAIDSLLSTKVGGRPPEALTGPAKGPVRPTAWISFAYFLKKQNSLLHSFRFLPVSMEPQSWF